MVTSFVNATTVFSLSTPMQRLTIYTGFDAFYRWAHLYSQEYLLFKIKIYYAMNIIGKKKIDSLFIGLSAYS